MLEQIQNGSFATEWILENRANAPSFMAMRRQLQNSLIEKVGAELRGMMSWIKK